MCTLMEIGNTCFIFIHSFLIFFLFSSFCSACLIPLQAFYTLVIWGMMLIIVHAELRFNVICIIRLYFSCCNTKECCLLASYYSFSVFAEVKIATGILIFYFCISYWLATPRENRFSDGKKLSKESKVMVLWQILSLKW